MSANFKLHILTPDRKFYDNEAQELKTENSLGRMEVLHNHTPLVTVLKPSITEFKDSSGKELKAFTSNGIMKISNNEVTILCDAAEWPEEIDKRRAEEAKRRAEEHLSKKEEFDIKRAENALQRAIMRLKAGDV